MKLKLILLLTCLLQASSFTLWAQKKPITNDSQTGWGGVDGGKISNDGKFVFYTQVENGTGKSVLTATDQSWSKDFLGYNAAFTKDSRFVFYQLGTDTLVKFNLAKKTSEYTLHVNLGSFQMSPSEKKQFIVYRSGKEVVLKNIATGKESRYNDVLEYRFNPTGDALLLRTKEAVSWINFPGFDPKLVSRSSKVSDTRYSYKFDNSGSAVALTISNKKGVNLYYYKTGMDSARLLVASHPEGTKDGTKLVDGNQAFVQSPVFTPDGHALLFRMKDAPEVIQRDTDVITDKVDVWNYKDANLQSQQMGITSTFDPLGWLINLYPSAVIPVSGGKIIPIDDSHSMMTGQIGNKYVLVKNISNYGEAYWNKSQATRYSLLSLDDGHRVSLNKEAAIHVTGLGIARLSAGEKFITWLDQEQKGIMCLEIATGILKNITKDLPAPVNQYAGKGIITDRSLEIINWFTGDEKVFIEDEFDIWQIDPKGLAAPVNITNGYGRKNRIKLCFAKHNAIITDKNEELILVAQDQQTMFNGFYRVKLGSGGDPVKGDMGPYNYYDCGLRGLQEPLKAKNANVYLVTRMSASDAPNYFVSKDLKSFTRLSDVRPQKDYNWMTSELIHYPKPDGRIGAAILYKPEDFDPHKKYPVIFHYYQSRSEEVYNFLSPDLSHGELNIPWYVSNGYLVCLPDIINDKPGYIAETVVNSVVSAAKYLCKNPWVDSTKMGIQGHSFGGYETNILLSRTNIFAAAQPSAGFSNLLSLYGSLHFGGNAGMTYMEMSQLDMRKSLWELPDLYREASPLLYLDKVTTPVLIQHSKKDGTDMDGGGVPFSQSTELFTALRRLQKPVWLLQYDNAGHIIGDPEQQLDFTIRQHQFFDHYLKGKPAPKWMTEGIDAKDKGLKSGLQLDTDGKQP